MKHVQQITKEKKFNKEAAFTLLEYCAGAAVIAGVLWVAMSALGNNLGDLLAALGEWATARSAELRG